ncbi:MULTISPECIES: metalloregulator ArsR/SmtB family transcription factor [unclassified Beijerinckia]|uniref:ArsR/SmtB family transcription factor n=1 Tax=unclassified Beijerinckia TaxID=2638183 RepID=UPI0008968BC9|nr:MULTISPECIES: metalloregulator ArsR/SmtB family transcription factor [unclassified Beijerinckia]MDH7797802.1 DNA-binding transcriptional ArsR family regulator [Beijerinckia sp. GAS462]SEC99067.1 transcriptional regulator, ArsR family [Beijerinckia sp. 28-YEA-48]
MIQVEPAFDTTLAALADPTRRAILQRLGGGDLRVTEIAKPYAISLNAVSKHIKVLENARLVHRRRVGREHILALDPRPMEALGRWIADQQGVWAARLQALDALLKAEDQVEGVAAKTEEQPHGR